MGAFRKRSTLVADVNHGSVGINHSVIPITKSVLKKGESEPTTFVEMKDVDMADYAKSLGLPHDEDYQLRDMIASGNIPQEVPVAGMLNSDDPTDLSNVGVGSRIFEHLENVVDSQAKSAQPAEPKVEPTPAE